MKYAGIEHGALARVNCQLMGNLASAARFI